MFEFTYVLVLPTMPGPLPYMLVWPVWALVLVVRARSRISGANLGIIDRSHTAIHTVKIDDIHLAIMYVQGPAVTCGNNPQ